ncbi:MAG: hypothetical protein OXU61_08615 [Gammaproteobacteria bacterium]|nr:hypothetical protein [Gammaproteobacteria bacterium]
MQVRNLLVCDDRALKGCQRVLFFAHVIQNYSNLRMRGSVGGIHLGGTLEGGKGLIATAEGAQDEAAPKVRATVT